MTDGHEDLHETGDAAVDQHQTSSRSTDCMAQLMGSQCDAAASESQVRGDQEQKMLEDTLVLMDDNEKLQKGHEDDKKKLKSLAKTVQDAANANQDLSEQLEHSLVFNYKNKQEVLKRLAPTSLAESSELAK